MVSSRGQTESDEPGTTDTARRTRVTHSPKVIGVLFMFGLLGMELPMGAWVTYIHGP